MSCINIIGKIVKADEEKSEIKWKLEEIRKIRTSFNIDVSRFRKIIDRDKLNQEEIERDNEKYKIIAKLSFDLFMDYEYYREFPIKKDSQFTNCAEELERLGYELRESAEWVNVRRPNIDTIIDQIFLSHLCQSILTRCVCCDAITRDGQSECDKCLNESNEKRIKTPAEEDNNKTDKRKCESLIPLNRSICDNYSNCANENKIMTDKCTNCYHCGSNKEIIDEGMCGDCFSARYNDWICQYRLCGITNIGSDRYCKSCGIERSLVTIVDTPIWRCKNHIRDQILICGKCELINEIDEGAVSCKCGSARRNVTYLTNDNMSNKQGKQVYDYQNKVNLFDKSIQTNNIDNNQLKSENKNKIFDDLPKWTCWKEYCKQSNSIDRAFCDKCKLQRDPPSGETDLVKMMIKGKITDIWFCWNKDCKKSNHDSHKFCTTCKLQRRPPENSADLVKKAFGGKISEIWICQKCQKHNINPDAKCKNNCGAYRFYTGALKTNEIKCNEYRGINESIKGIKEKNGEHCKSLIDDGNKEKHNLDKKENTSNNNNQWTCFYCGKPNELSNKYCQDCCLDRHGSHEQGAPVNYESQKHSKKIWLCYKCKKHNILSDATCGAKTCNQTRFVTK